MQISCQTFWLPKYGSSSEEYEDAFYPTGDSTCQKRLFRCAVADGATETSFSGLWAQLLSKAYVENDIDLEELSNSWKQQTNKADQPWYVEEKLASGAFATLVGLTIRASKDRRENSGTWESSAVGDSCIFQVRKNELLTSYPLDRWQQFNSSPELLSSETKNNSKELVAHLQETIEEEWRSGDTFYLMSDAIACWFLRRHVESEDAIQIVSTWDSTAAMKILVDQERVHKDDIGRLWMRNDDVTLMRVKVTA
jgi:hypothetical protein